MILYNKVVKLFNKKYLYKTFIKKFLIQEKVVEQTKFLAKGIIQNYTTFNEIIKIFIQMFFIQSLYTI